ncbi:MAG: LuxR family transcriptional regulator [Dehalococcoidia bacterium SM23_28_1]|nr:MAG: LuxR family transcriptional regulator [Dehalococcoidia bacterium SM23_28_1]
MEKIRVLLAEDHVVVREGTRELVQREEDMEVVGEAGDGEEAIELATNLRPDVVIMDIAMPKVNGIEATKRIKELHPAIAVLILTAYDSEQYIFALLEAGAAGYLLKNVRGSELIDAVRAVRAGESVLHPVATRKVLERLRGAEGRPGDEAGKGILSEREMEVLRLASKGISNKDIARELVVSVRTVQAHLGNIFNKLGVGSRTEAVLYALRKGWFSLEEEI